MNMWLGTLSLVYACKSTSVFALINESVPSKFIANADRNSPNLVGLPSLSSAFSPKLSKVTPSIDNVVLKLEYEPSIRWVIEDCILNSLELKCIRELRAT